MFFSISDGKGKVGEGNYQEKVGDMGYVIGSRV
jgi:hypothetical protein